MQIEDFTMPTEEQKALYTSVLDELKAETAMIEGKLSALASATEDKNDEALKNIANELKVEYNALLTGLKNKNLYK